MVKFIDFFRLIRSKNLILIVLTQFLIRYGLIIPLTGTSALSKIEFTLLVLSTLFIAAGGYIINDYFDLQVDRLNQRKLIIDNTIKRREAILMHLLLSFFGVFIGFYLGWKLGHIGLGFVNLFSASALWFYSTNFKKSMLSGNILISLLASLSLLIIPLYDIIPKPSINSETAFYIICCYSVFAFITSFIREVIKDFEDSQGDSEMGYTTFAIVYPKFAKISVQLLALSLILVLGFISSLQIINKAHYAALYILVLVVIPFIYFLVKSKSAKSKSDYYQLSQIMKLIMLTGILSILFFTILF
ncbi:MAG: geranylgeranylglycerol-phosphate geranylgeranyltransferase [Flavobacteriales bacterium]